MELINKKEIADNNEFNKFIMEKGMNIDGYRPAVIALITDKEGNILLQRRGPKSRDDKFKLEDISGAVEEEDRSFRDAVRREMTEEVGSLAKFEIKEFVGCFLNRKYDYRVNEYVNWVFFVYKVDYIDGELKIMEPDKCLEYVFYNYDNLPLEDVTKSSIFYWDFYKNNFDF